MRPKHMTDMFAETLKKEREKMYIVSFYGDTAFGDGAKRERRF